MFSLRSSKYPLTCFGLIFFLLSAGAHEVSVEGLRHWETASRDPDRIILTFTEDPATEIAVTWRTSKDAERGVVHVAEAGDHPRFDLDRREVEASTEALNLNRAPRNSQGSVHYHSATVSGLLPSTLYAYRVGDGEERWSEWIQFRTAAEHPEPFTFLYFGDAQNAVLSHWSRIIRSAYAKAPEARLAVHAGDLIHRAHSDRQWAEWFKAGGWIHSSIGNIVVPGNHEYDPLDQAEGGQKQLSLQWRPQFQLPVVESLSESLHETAYYIDYQGVRFIALNSNRGLALQAEWLEEVLADNPNNWTVLVFHHPMFSSGKGRDRPEWRDLLKPVIDRHNVDLVLQGHDHTYARGHIPVTLSDTADTPDGDAVGSVYVNSISGAKMYELRENGWDVYNADGVHLRRSAENTQFFQVIRVDGNRLMYQAYTATGLLYDRFSLLKFPDGRKKLEKSQADSRRFENTPPYSRDRF